MVVDGADRDTGMETLGWGPSREDRAFYRSPIIEFIQPTIPRGPGVNCGWSEDDSAHTLLLTLRTLNLVDDTEMLFVHEKEREGYLLKNRCLYKFKDI